MFDYLAQFETALAALRDERRYRVFAELERPVGRLPFAVWRTPAGPREVVVWCSNDYLGMSQHPKVVEAMCAAARDLGAGAGGTRNISGTSRAIVALEDELADLHGKEAALAPGFIFTTALCPAIAAAATASIAHLKASQCERAAQQSAVAATKAALTAAGLPVLTTDTHIVPVMVGDADLCKQASDRLLEQHGIYIQPINYPTVPRGTERLRITPGPFHDARLVARLTKAMTAVWRDLGLRLGVTPEQPHQQAETITAGG